MNLQSLMSQPATLMTPGEVQNADYLDATLLHDGKLVPISAHDLDCYPWNHVRIFCHRNARYGLPTKELVQWLKEIIGDRSAIEIGCGHGDLANQLGIPATDSRLQENPKIKAYYEALGQPVIKYPSDVERLEAIEAIDKYRPKVVVGSWITEWIDPDKPPDRPGSVWGVKEWKILKKVDTYITIGNIAVHKTRKLLEQKHECFELPFIRSRASQPELDRVWVWNR